MKNIKILISISLFLLIGCSSYIPEVNKNEIIDTNKLTNNNQNDDQNLNFTSQKWWEIYNDKNLNEIMQITLESNTDLNIALLNIEKTKNQMNLAKNEIETSVNARALTLSSGKNTTYPEQLAGDNFNIALATLDVGYQFDFFNKYSNLVKQQSYLVKSGKLYADLIQLNISTNITTLYGYYIYLNNQNKLFNEQLELFDELQINAQKNIDTGFGDINDLLIINNDIFETKNQLNLNLAQISITENTINLLSSYKNREKIKNILKVALNDQSILQKEIIIPNEISSSVISNRPDVKYYLAIINSQEAKLKSLEADFYPQFSIGGNVGYLGFGKNNPYQNFKAAVWSLGPKVSLPVLNLKNLKSNYKIGAIDLNIFIEDYNKTIHESYSNIEESLTNSKIAKINTSNSNESLKNNSLILGHSNTNYEIGSISKDQNSIDRLTYIGQKMKNENERYKLYSSQITLINTLGGVYKENKKKL